MTKGRKIRLTHPKSGLTLTLKEWALRLGYAEQTMSQRYHTKYTKGLISLEELLGGVELMPESVTPNTFWGNEKKITYVFRLVYCNDEPAFYEAYDPKDLLNPVMDSIVWSPFGGGGWFYNCYPFGCFRTKNELVREYLKGDWQRDYPELKHGY